MTPESARRATERWSPRWARIVAATGVVTAVLADLALAYIVVKDLSDRQPNDALDGLAAAVAGIAMIVVTLAVTPWVVFLTRRAGSIAFVAGAVLLSAVVLLTVTVTL